MYPVCGVFRPLRLYSRLLGIGGTLELEMAESLGQRPHVASPGLELTLNGTSPEEFNFHQSARQRITVDPER